MTSSRNLRNAAPRRGWVRPHPIWPHVWTATTPFGDVLRDSVTGAPRLFHTEADAAAALCADAAERQAAHRRDRVRG